MMDEKWTKSEQSQLEDYWYSQGEDPDDWRCRTCGKIYDGGQFCSYCGDRNPLNDPEIEYEDW